MKLYDHSDLFFGEPPLGSQPSVTLHAGLSGVRHRPLAYVREMVKLNVRALRHRAATRRWLELLNSHPVFSEIARDCPRLLYKIYRPYLTNTLGVQQRIDVLASHYRFLFRRGLAPTVAQAARGKLLLGTVDGKSGERYELTLRAIEVMEREGELVLQLSRGGQMVYGVAFTFSDLDGISAIRIGCVQGPKTDGLTLVREATRDLHGLRPKQLMVNLVRQLGFAMGCTELRLVGNGNRTVHSALRNGRVLADYDQMWQEIGAEQQRDGDFRIACAPLTAPDMATTASNKRAETRRRHDVALTLAGMLGARFGVR